MSDSDFIPFVQFMRPHGTRKDERIERPLAVVQKARELIDAGCTFEAEVLSTGHVSFEVVGPDDLDGDPISLAGEIADNGPGIPETVDRLVEEAHRAFKTEFPDGFRVAIGQGASEALAEQVQKLEDR